MKIRAPYHLPADRQADLNYLIRLAWWNVISRTSIVLVMALVLGSSQAMKAAWVDDLISLIPPIAFLIAMHYHNRPPNAVYPYGYQRSAVISFLCASVALSLFGFYLLVDSLIHLISAEHPSIGGITLFGTTFWMGWLMIAALIYSIIPPLIIARLQLPVAKRAHEKTSYVDAQMGKADWMTGVAAIVGIVGVGFGLWWADALAAGLIALDIIKDGLTSLKQAVGDLLDRRPILLSDSKPDRLVERLEQALLAMPWVASAAVRLREEGHLLSGEAFVVPVSDDNLTDNIADACRVLTDQHWRIYEVIITVVPEQLQSRPTWQPLSAIDTAGAG